jgi:excisionase family DNA binding protein
MNEEKYYTRTEIAKILSVNPMTVYREIRRGKLKAIRVGKDYRIPESALEDYRKNQTVKYAEKK